MLIGYGAIHPCLKSAIEIAPVTVEKGINNNPLRLSQLTAKGTLAAESNQKKNFMKGFPAVMQWYQKKNFWLISYGGLLYGRF